MVTHRVLPPCASSLQLMARVFPAKLTCRCTPALARYRALLGVPLRRCGATWARASQPMCAAPWQAQVLIWGHCFGLCLIVVCGCGRGRGRGRGWCGRGCGRGVAGGPLCLPVVTSRRLCATSHLPRHTTTSHITPCVTHITQHAHHTNSRALPDVGAG